MLELIRELVNDKLVECLFDIQTAEHFSDANGPYWVEGFTSFSFISALAHNPELACALEHDTPTAHRHTALRVPLLAAVQVSNHLGPESVFVGRAILGKGLCWLRVFQALDC